MEHSRAASAAERECKCECESLSQRCVCAPRSEAATQRRKAAASGRQRQRQRQMRPSEVAEEISAQEAHGDCTIWCMLLCSCAPTAACAHVHSSDVLAPIVARADFDWHGTIQQ